MPRCYYKNNIMIEKGDNMIKGLFCGVKEYKICNDLEFCINDACMLKKALCENYLIDNNNIQIIGESGYIDNIT